MGLIDKTLARFGYKRAPQRRAFSGAQTSNLTWSWATQPLHVNAELQKGLKALRARSRDLEQNNDYARKFLSMVETNVVGHSGFSVFIEPKRPDGTVDRYDAARLENAFWRWATQCEVTGLSFTEVQRLFIRTVARDGEVGVRFVRRGPFGLQMQLVDPTLIDEQYNTDLPGGRKVRMGVEYDEWGVVQAYYLSQRDAADPSSGDIGAQRVRVPAEEMRLYFPRMAIGQLRGVPFMASAMLRMQMLGGYEEAAVVAARVGAAKMGAITTEDGDITGMGDATDGNGNALIDGAEPGGFFNLPPGSKLESWDPDYPHAQYADFVRGCLRGISSGLGVSYATLANDLENVNYSSIRAGVLEEREVWKALQGWMIDAFLVPLYAEWLKAALLSGKLDPLPASKFDKFNAARWQGRRWDWVDPERDMNANILAIKHGLKSRTEVVAEQGRDIADVWSDLSQEQKDAEAQGVRLEDLAPKPAATPVPPPEDDSGDDQDEDDTEDDTMRTALLAIAGREGPVVNVAPATVAVNVAESPEALERFSAAVVAAAAPILERTAQSFAEVAAAQTETLVKSLGEAVRAIPAPVVNVPPPAEYQVAEAEIIYGKDGRPKGTRTVKQRVN